MGILPSCHGRNALHLALVRGPLNEISCPMMAAGETGSPRCGHPRGWEGGFRVTSWSQKSIVPSGGLVTLQLHTLGVCKLKKLLDWLTCSQTTNDFLLSWGAKYINTWAPQLKKLGFHFSSGWIGVKGDSIHGDPKQIRTKYHMGASHWAGHQKFWAQALYAWHKCPQSRAGGPGAWCPPFRHTFAGGIEHTRGGLIHGNFATRQHALINKNTGLIGLVWTQDMWKYVVHSAKQAFSSPERGFINSKAQ